MAHEYVFRGERKPFAPDPEDQRAREQAKREADRLVNRARPEHDLPADAEVERLIGDYQVGGLDAFGASSTQSSSQSDSRESDIPSDATPLQNVQKPAGTS